MKLTIILPHSTEPTTYFQQLNGRRVLVTGDITYDRECWDGQRECVPAGRPIYLGTGTLTILK